jgi:hypothetical protein
MNGPQSVLWSTLTNSISSEIICLNTIIESVPKIENFFTSHSVVFFRFVSTFFDSNKMHKDEDVSSQAFPDRKLTIMTIEFEHVLVR